MLIDKYLSNVVFDHFYCYFDDFGRKLNIPYNIRDGDNKENPVKSGFLQIGGGWGSRGPPDPDFLHVDQNVNPDFDGWGDSESGITELKVFEHSFC